MAVNLLFYKWLQFTIYFLQNCNRLKKIVTEQFLRKFKVTVFDAKKTVTFL